MSKAHFAMERGMYAPNVNPPHAPYFVSPICGAYADSFVGRNDQPPFNIRAAPHFQGEPCRRCVRKARALGVAWPPQPTKEAKE